MSVAKHEIYLEMLVLSLAKLLQIPNQKQRIAHILTNNKTYPPLIQILLSFKKSQKK